MAIGRFGGDYIRSLFHSKNILLVGGLTTVTGLLLVVFLPLEYVVIFGLFLAGIGLSVTVPILFSEASKTAGVVPSVGLASVATFSIVGFMCGPPVIGFVSEATTLSVDFAGIAFLALCGVILVAMLLKK